jgi:ribonuclease-3
VTDRARWAEAQLRYTFNDPSLLEQALTHRSASKRNNERLEYLGDSFLNFSIASRLYHARPADTEGDLSRARAALVREETLAAVAHALKLDAQLTLGAGELRSGGAQRSAILADALEALIGAVLLDGGAAAAEALVERLFGEQCASLPDAAALKDPKTRLQEWLQGRGQPLPSYRVTAVEGRDHEQMFFVECEAAGSAQRTAGRGPSRRRAEQDAAAAMLVVLTGESI